MRSRETLDSAYRATSYVAAGPDEREIRIWVCEEHPELDGVLQEYGVASWAFLTSCNPRSEPLSDEENATRVSALLTDLEAQGYQSWNGAGIGEGASWTPEPSFLVFGISRGAASELANRYEQYAFVFGETGERAELVWTHLAPELG